MGILSFERRATHTLCNLKYVCKYWYIRLYVFATYLKSDLCLYVLSGLFRSLSVHVRVNHRKREKWLLYPDRYRLWSLSVSCLTIPSSGFLPLITTTHLPLLSSSPSPLIDTEKPDHQALSGGGQGGRVGGRKEKRRVKASVCSLLWQRVPQRAPS